MIALINPNTKMVKECPTGYSWTTFFFGMFVPLFRGDLKWAIIFLVATILAGAVSAGILSFFAAPIFGFFYNKIYITDMVAKGYIGNSPLDTTWLVNNGIIASNSVAPIEEDKQ